MQGVSGSSMWVKGGRKTRRELEQALSDDKNNHAARFALVQLLAFTGEYSAADVSNEKEISTTMHWVLLFSLEHTASHTTYTMQPIEKRARKYNTGCVNNPI